MAGVNDNLIPPKPGEVRNPGGKPKGTIHLSTAIQQMLDDPGLLEKILAGVPANKIPQYLQGNASIKTAKKAIIAVGVSKALSGDKQWADWLAKNGYGEKLSIEAENPIVAILAKYGGGHGEDIGELEETPARPSEDST
jgi:hypothetical protein